MQANAVLLLLVAVVGAACGLGEDNAVSSTTTVDDSDVDEESDSAVFMIVVEHEDDFRCSASLVSQRTALTTAWCALGRRDAPSRTLWAFASALLAARPPAPLAAAARRVRRLSLAASASHALDLSVLELEEPFGFAANMRPILLATNGRECERSQQCNAVRSLPSLTPTTFSIRRVRLRVVDLTRAKAERCGGHVPKWPATPRRLECYSGDKLCEIDLGGGIVCAGRLCAVLGEITVDASFGTPDVAERCGITYTAMAVSHWRRFLLCAHTLRLCGRGDCAKLCTEHRLITDDNTTGSEATYVNETLDISWNEPNTDVTKLTVITAEEELTKASNRPTRTYLARSFPMTIFSSPFSPSAERIAKVFEPNRADFKAGEYGDNAAEYDSEESVLPTRTTSAPAAARTSPSPTQSTPRAPPAVERRVSPSAGCVIIESIDSLYKISVAILLMVG